MLIRYSGYDADCGAVGLGVFQLSRRAASPPMRFMEGEQKRGALAISRVFSPQNWVEPSEIVLSTVWCSRLTTGAKNPALHLRCLL
ncbi:hypothetical protein TNCV_4370951 [Trichonephila clavipes]|nr:hypothetical protein TNCV_4370951 [Trichonephila clavipes]